MFKIVVLLLSIAAAVNSTPVELTLRERQTLLQTDLETRQVPGPNYRLNDYVIPIHYDILLHPYFADEGNKVAFTFDGNITIRVRATQPNQATIVLHANRLTVADDWLVYEHLNPSVVIPHPIYEYDEVTHKMTLHLNRVLQTDRDYVIEMNYVGVMGDDMAGFYRSYYTDNGVRKWLGTTQFQTTSARRAFPCFDEPKYKATFKISMERPSSYSTLSNTRIETSIALSSTVSRDTFKTTPKMSSYLIAFIVSDYRGRQTPNLVHGMYAREGAYDQTEYSLQFANSVLQKLDEFTGYPYLSVPELEKLDQAAIPDFSAGAMENWGLMTYRETSILFHPQHSTATNKHRIAAVITHEAAHQWFGDLVTCEWWDATWLNEGFARYFQYFGTRMVETEWELESIYTVEQVQSAFQMDSLTSTHAMTSEVNTPGQVSAIFDNISYNKASAVIRMLEHMIGSDRFMMALQDYLSQNAYSATRPEHLWTAMQNRVPELQVARIIDPWTTQSGYPYITVTVDGTSVSVTQRRFLLKDKDHSDTTTWPIPLTYATKQSDFTSTKPQEFYTNEDGATKNFTLTEAPESYFIVNNQQTGFYRVNYDVDNWMKIKAALHSENYGGIHVLNRAQIVDDLFNFARSGIVGYGTALEILEYIKAEKHYVPWLAFFNGLTHLTRRIATAADLELFEFQVLDILEEIYEHIGFYPKEGDTQTQIYTRNNVLAWLCRYGHEDCLKNAKDEFSKFVAAPNAYLVNPDHRAVVYCEGLRAGTASDFTMLWNRYLNINVGAEVSTILTAMGCTKDPVLLRQLLSNILTDAVRYQDKGAAFSSVLSGNPENVDVAYEFLTNNYNSWAENYGFNGMNAVSSAFASILDRYTDPAKTYTLNNFLTANAQAIGAGPLLSIRNAVIEAQWQMEWADTHAPAIREFLEEKMKTNSATSVTISVLCIMSSTVLSFLLH